MKAHKNGTRVNWHKVIVKDLGKSGTFAEAEKYARKLDIDLSVKKWKLIRRELFGESV